ncbi:hypothetical protein [uncultured Methanospirillum sp.]|uniref:hypothetical protein n=1 Tax=uncultured Methanospirillum sp. TaxID=262503 RepID=UPI0029C8C268|nr:hypothetical protein [uncultured Methanospirillum sp.]
MNCDSDTINAEVIAINPDNIKISIYKIEDFSLAETSLKIGSYLQIFDNNNASIIAIIQNYQIEIFFESQTPRRRYIVEAFPIGILYESGQFIRGGDDLAIPQKPLYPHLN